MNRWTLAWLIPVLILAGSWYAVSAQRAADAMKAMPRKSIPTFSNENIARMGFF